MFRRWKGPSSFSRKPLLLGLAAVVLLVAVAAIGVRWFLSGDRVRIALEQQATVWLGQPVRIGTARATILPRVALRLRDVTVGDPVRLSLAQVDLSTGLLALLSRRIEDAEVIISDSRIQMPLPFGLPATPPSPPAAAAGAAAMAIELVSIRAITLRDVTLASRGREVELDAESALDGARLTISSLTARAGETVIDAHGTVDLEPRVIATIDAKAEALDFDALLAVTAAFTPSSSTAPAGDAPAQITANITAERGWLAGVPLARFEASLLADGTDIRIEPLEFDLLGGRYDGWLDVAFGEMLAVRVGAGVSNLDVAQLAALGGVGDSITGRLSGSGRIGASGPDMSAALAASRGIGEVTISSGTLRHLDVVRTVVLFFGRPDAEAPPPEGERFESISATFALAEQSLRSDDLTLQSPDFDLFARGTLALPTKALDVRANLVLSEALSAQAGRDLYRYTRSGDRIVLPAIVGGTLADPSVRIDAAAALRRGVMNEVERRLQDLLEQVKPPLP